jgi:hypothetical protein
VQFASKVLPVELTGARIAWAAHDVAPDVPGSPDDDDHTTTLSAGQSPKTNRTLPWRR